MAGTQVTINNLTLKAHPLGGIATLTWELDTVTGVSSIELHRGTYDSVAGKGSYATSTPIASWSTALETKGRYVDLTVSNNVHYAYKLIVKHSDTLIENAEKEVNVVVKRLAEVTFPDTKAAVKEALELVKKNHSTVLTAASIQPYQKLTGSFAIPVFTVTRANQSFDSGVISGATASDVRSLFAQNAMGQEFMANQLGTVNLPSGRFDETGLVEYDNILITWRCSTYTKRDTITNLMREARAELLYVLKERGISEARIVLGSDFYEDTVKSVATQTGTDATTTPDTITDTITETGSGTVYGGSMMIQCRFENKTSYQAQQFVAYAANPDGYDENTGMVKQPYLTDITDKIS